MKCIVGIISLVYFLTLQSCRPSLGDYAIEWSKDTKQKIIEDASRYPDSTFFDTTENHLTLFKGGKKLKVYWLRLRYNNDEKKSSFDTVVSIFYSTDQNFELVRELCPAVDRNFEGIKYKNYFLGLTLLTYCDGKTKEKGFRYNDRPVGVWTTYDEDGNKLKEVDNGNVEDLENLYNIKYAR
jgi:hypothetical protein